MILYHGSKEIVEFPEIRTARYNKDFIWVLLHTDARAGSEMGNEIWNARLFE